ncbi:MAG: hypothetical protein ACHQ5A_06935 [Opitutales bacterium]
MGQVHRSQQLISEGLTIQGSKRQYLELLSQVTRYLDDYRTLLEVVDQVEAQSPPPEPALGRWLDGQRVLAWEKLGQPELILALRDRRARTPLISIDQAWARIMAARGRAAEALAAIQAEPDRFGLPAERYALQFSLARSAGDRKLVQKTLVEWEALNPKAPEPRIEELLDVAAGSDRELLRERVALFFIDFSPNHAAVVQFLQRMLALPSSDWQQVVWEEAGKVGLLRAIDVRVIRVQDLMQSGRLEEAQGEYLAVRELIRKSRMPDGGWNQATGLLLDLLANDSPSARMQFYDYCTRQQLMPASFQFVLRCLRNRGMTPVAQEVLSLARNRFPAFMDAPGSLAPLTVAGAAPVKAPEAASAASDTANEPPRLAISAEDQLRRTDQELAAGHLDEAGSLLRRLALDYPAQQHQEPVLYRQVRLHGLQGEQADLAASLHLYLDLTEANLAALRDLALAWEKTPQSESALTLAREVSERHPQARWAGELRSRLQVRFRVVPLELTPSPTEKPGKR